MVRKNAISSFIVISIFILNFNAFSECMDDNERFYQEHERGWFYKEVCEEEKKVSKGVKDTQKLEQKKKRKSILLPETTLDIPFDKLDKMDPDYINELYIKARKIAIMYPTKHNIKQYQKLVMWIANKSFIFTENWIKTVRTDTELAKYASEVPTSSVRRTQYFIYKNQYRKQILNKFKDKIGLVVIVKTGCSYCEKQKIIIRWLKEDTGIEYKLVNINNVPNMVRKFGIARVPDIFLVVKGRNGKPMWTRIATGLHSKGELKDLILFGLYNLGLIEPPEKAMVLH